MTQANEMVAVQVHVRPHMRPRLWARLSVPAGNLAQGAGLAFGAICLVLAAGWHGPAVARGSLMLLGWLSIYCSSHAIAHYAVGRLVGINFVGFGMRGTEHPENYPPGIRQVMRVMPFFTALTDKVSMRRATPKAKALMFAAGKTATAICSLAVAAFASLSQIPGGSWLLFATYWLVFCSIIMTAFTARGDYARALKTLRAGAQPSNG